MGMIFASSMTRQLPRWSFLPRFPPSCSTAIWRHQAHPIAPSILPADKLGDTR